MHERSLSVPLRCASQRQEKERRTSGDDAAGAARAVPEGGRDRERCVEERSALGSCAW